MNPVAKAKLPLMLAVLAMAGSLTLSPMAFAKHAAFELPACDRLMDGEGPPSAEKPNPETTGTEVVKPTQSKDLSPMKLTNDKDSFSVGNDGQVKMTVEENVSKQAEGATVDPTAAGVPESVIKTKKGDIGDKLVRDAKSVNVGPLTLLESEEEAQKKSDTIGDAERTQLTDLWSATINRSPDIQFVINRLQPTTDQSHATATAIKMLSGALFSAVQAVPLMMPGGAMSSASYMGIGSGTSMLQNLLSGADAKNVKKAQISQEQATILYKIVRDTADKLVLEYRKYRKCRSDFDRSNRDLEDLRMMVAQARSGQDPSKQIEMEYTIRKAQRDVENVSDEAGMHRQSLADLAGPDALSKLDSEMEQEVVALKNLTGDSTKLQPELADQVRPELVEQGAPQTATPQTASDPRQKMQ